jgi:spore protease
MMRSVRTDLAAEARELAGQSIPGVESDVNTDDKDITVTRVRVLNDTGASAMGKPPGLYINIDATALKNRDPEFIERVSRRMAQEMESLLPDMGRNATVLVVGLGNWNITPDALGPRVVAKMMVTRHLIQLIPDQVDERVRSVCAMAPGVLGITGIETGEIILGVVEKIKPAAMIAIDALASRSTARLGTTIQITDSGICPGSGVGNNRMQLNCQTLGVPVISIGVPLVVYAGTIARDVIELLDGTLAGDKAEHMIQQVVSEHLGDLIVTPKEIDAIVDDVARMLSLGLNLMIHKGVTVDEIDRFMM